MAILLGLALTLAPSTLLAQSPLDRGLETLRTGDYDRAVRLLTSATASGATTERVRAARALARAHAATGGYEQALESLDRVGRELPAVELAATRGQLLRRLGRDDEARAAFVAAIDGGASDALTARLHRSILLWERGEREEAYAAFDGFIDVYNDGGARTAAERTAVGTAVRWLGRRDPDLLHDAVRAYESALRVDPDAVEPRLRMAELFLAAYDAPEARSLLGEVLAVNPRHAEALRLMARARRFEGSSEAMELAERAVAVDPVTAEGWSLLALLRLELGEDDAAVAAAERGLASNPRSREALAARGAARFLGGDAAGYRVDRQSALVLDPRFAGFDVTVAELAVRRNRYRDAVELAGRAVALDSTAWDGWALLGMNQLRTGEIEAARASLERAFRGDPFNVWTKNTLDLMDRLAAFRTVRTERFELVLAPEEAALLAPYAGAIAEEAYTALSERYDYAPETPVRVEIYPRHADFSVRTMGLTGLGALGVAFGNTLAMDSPAARDRGAFHWGSTLWHEIAHAVTLGLTGHRVPRWLTEGISVREERRSRPGWGGRPGLAFLQAFQEGRLLPLEEINRGFLRPSYPGQVIVSYQHAGLIVELIEADHGPAAVSRLLEAFAGGRDTRAAFREALGVQPAAVDARLKAHVEERYGAGLTALATLGQGASSAHPGAGAGALVAPGGDPDALVRAARMDRNDYGAQLAAGHALADTGRLADAVPFLERARSLWPDYTGPGSPYPLLARARTESGDRAGAIEVLRTLTERSETALEGNLQLAGLLEETGDAAGAAEALERAIFIYPYDPEPHARLAELAVRLERPALEVRERAALVALDPVDRAGALYRLALAQRRAGDATAARRTVMRALEVAPDYADAQDLFLALSGGDR